MAKKYTLEEFESDLASVILPIDEVVFVFSGIWAFAKFLDVQSGDVAQAILKSICHVVTEKRTLVMPAYNFSFCTTGYFDARTTPSESGVITELFRQMDGVQRTQSPINSYCVNGPLAEELMSIRNATLWGDNSQISWLDKVNARMVKVGTGGWHRFPYLHRVEEERRVPYRYFKVFAGTWTDGEVTMRMKERYYVRYLEIVEDNDWSSWEREMRRNRLFLTPERDVFQIESTLAQDALDTGLELVTKDPYCLVRNKERVRQWVESNT